MIGPTSPIGLSFRGGGLEAVLACRYLARLYGVRADPDIQSADRQRADGITRFRLMWDGIDALVEDFATDPLTPFDRELERRRDSS